MGFTPQQVDQMSLWQFTAALNGYIAANTPADDKTLDEDQIDALARYIEG